MQKPAAVSRTRRIRVFLITTSAVIAALMLLLATAAAQSAGGASQGTKPRREQPAHAPDRLLVRFRPGTSPQMADAVHRGVGGSVLRRFRSVPGLSVVQLPAGTDLRQAIRAYQQQPQVLYAEPDYLVHMDTTPNDPYYSDLWGLRKIQAAQAWDVTTGSANVVVGVIDTGIDYTHPDLAANVYRNEADCNGNGLDDDGDGYIDDCYGIDTANHDSDPMDDNRHGSHVSGTIGALGNNSVGVVGVNWNVKLFACKALDASGTGDVSNAIECLDYFAWMKDHGVNLVATNNSWGGQGYSQALLDAIDQQRQRDILFIAAAGNSGWDNDTFYKIYPADYDLPNIISVAATDSQDQLPAWSNYGRLMADLGAPGVSILSTTPGNNYGFDSGTSMATPHVTGVAALLKAQDPSRNFQQTKNLILTGTDPVSALADKTLSGGRLNAYNAVTCSNRVLQRRTEPYSSFASVPPGQPLTVAMLSLSCDHATTSAQVTVQETGEVISLHDDGVAPDTAAGDGLFYGQFTETVLGRYTVVFPGGDQVVVNVAPGYAFAPDAYSWRTITGTNLWLGTDGDFAQITLPFPIQFGGASQNTLYVSDVGTVTFNSGMGMANSVNETLPAGISDAVVAPWWDDIYPYSFVPDDGNVFYDVLGSAPNRELVIEWRNVGFNQCYGALGNSHVDFQIVFSEATNDVLFNYANVDPDLTGCAEDVAEGASGTVGIQLSSDTATQYSFNRRSLSNGLALRWSMVGANPAPVLSSLLPDHVASNSGGFTLSLSGTGFAFGSQVLWNGSSRPTTVVSSTEVTATISASDLTAPGAVDISVVTPAPGGGSSNTLPFMVTVVPALVSISPTNAAAGGPSFTLQVNGSSFVDGDVVRWNGAPLATTFVSATELNAAIPASDLVSTGIFPITVSNTTGDVSNSGSFSVVGPSLGAISPWTAPAGSGAFTLTVNGSNFVSGSTVRWNGSDRTTTFVDATQLTAAINATDVANIASAQVTVANPGGAATSGITFSVIGPVPTSLTPSTVTGGGTTFTITVQGSGFVSTDTVRWNGSARTTTFVSSSQLTAAAAAADLGAPGNIAITVQNAQGYVSPALPLAVSDFSASLSPSSVSVSGGQPATYTVTIGNVYGAFANSVQLTCSLPSGFGTCSFSPASMTPGSGTVTSTLTVQTTVNSAALRGGNPWQIALLATVLALPLGIIFAGGKWRLWRAALLLLVLSLASLVVSCGGTANNSPPPPAPRTGVVTVTGTSGSLQHVTTAGLTIR